MFHRERSRNRRKRLFLIGGIALAAMLGSGIFMMVRRNMRQSSLLAPRQHDYMMSHNEPYETGSEMDREVTILEDAQNRAFPL